MDIFIKAADLYGRWKPINVTLSEKRAQYWAASEPEYIVMQLRAE